MNETGGDRAKLKPVCLVAAWPLWTHQVNIVRPFFAGVLNRFHVHTEREAAAAEGADALAAGGRGGWAADAGGCGPRPLPRSLLLRHPLRGNCALTLSLPWLFLGSPLQARWGAGQGATVRGAGATKHPPQGARRAVIRGSINTTSEVGRPNTAFLVMERCMREGRVAAGANKK